MYDIKSTQNPILTLINSMYIKNEQLLLIFRFTQVFTLSTKSI